MLAGLALAVAFAVVCVLLGRWQWGRYEDKVTRAAAITTHYTAAPVPLESMLGRLPLAESDEWTRVSTTGRYAVRQQLLVRNRALSGAGGLEVLVPLDLDAGAAGAGGSRLLVDRGWVANPASATELPAVPPSPAGTVTVQGWLRHGEVDLRKGLPEGQLASITVAGAHAQVGGALLDTYLVLESEQTPAGVVPARPTPLEQPDTGLGPHQAYAFQWWLTSTFGFVLLGHRLRVAVATGRADVGTESMDAVETPRVRKVRIWDEEDA